MQPNQYIAALEQNAKVIEGLFSNLPPIQYTWKPAPEQWCLLELICHLYDEEIEDFRARLNHVLHTPNEPLPPSDPLGWAANRNYMGQDYEQKLADFLAARHTSVDWLKSLQSPKWDNAFIHKTYGPLTATMFLANWPAHDYLHIRQAIKIQHQYLSAHSGEDMRYAGDW